MSLIADILMAGGAFGVAVYCFVLSRRLTRFTDLERGVGGAVAVLSAQVDDLTKALQAARSAADNSGQTLKDLTERAEDASRRLEMHVASLHDLEPAPSSVSETENRPAPAAVAPRPVEVPKRREEPQIRDVPTFRSVSSQTSKPKPIAATPKVPSYFAHRAAASAK